MKVAFKLNKSWQIKAAIGPLIIVAGLVYMNVFFFKALIANQLSELQIFEKLAPIGLIVGPIIIFYFIFPFFKKGDVLKLDKAGLHLLDYPSGQTIPWAKIIEVNIEDRNAGLGEFFKYRNWIRIHYTTSKGVKEVWLPPRRYSIEAEKLKKYLLSFWRASKSIS